MNVVLRTKRLMLRPLGVSDLESTFSYASDKSILYMTFLPYDSIAVAQRFLEGAQAEWQKDAPSFFEFAIVLDGKHIGAVSAYLSEDKKTAELGWVLNKDYRGYGYATEAASALKDFVINTVGVKEIIAHCDVRNVASARVMEKIGLKLIDANEERFYKARNEKSTGYTYGLTVDTVKY